MIFAELEMLANAAVLNQLANVLVTIPGQVLPVPGIFKNPSSVAALGVGAADTTPTVLVDSGAVPAGPVDQVIEIAGTRYVILDDAPDGTGLTLLALGLAE